jgi:hypothetical protein
MGFWENILMRLRGVFGRRRGVPPPIPPPIPIIPKRYVLNIVYGHIIYQPLQKANFDIKGIKTLERFLEIANIQDVEQKRTDHPLALEVYTGFTLHKPITPTSREYRIIVEGMKDAITDTYPQFSEGILDFMEWGIETAKEIDEPQPLEGQKRWSYDGEHFNEASITQFMRRRIGRFLRA